MAFHVACPITCRRICFCSLGFSLDLGKSKEAFCKEVLSVEELLQDPWGTAGVSPESTIQVRVPKLDVLSVSLVPAVSAIQVDGAAIEDGGDDAEVEEAGVSAQAKRGPLQKVAASVFAAEDYARKLESGDVAVPAKDFGLEQHGHSNENVLCDLCFLGVKEGGGRAGRMLPCKSCGKKYHRSCLKNWSQHRDLFHWSSWTCPSCQICEVCQKTGDPRKFAFCKRCDAAYHCYCQHPPHKNVGAGPYLCPKHTKCHSCGSSVPGNGLSVRWFLGYTCCDACGRLFVKGNYCPICLKVYRDSESTPMVCCDICQRWVHCQCDGISDEKYMQFQVDGNLQYKCATCRGECYQVKDLEDAVQQLWKKKDVADRELIASLRADAGLPTEEELFAISSYSDDDGDIPAIGRPLRLSLKLTDRTPKKSKEHGKIYLDKKIIKKKVSKASATSKSESLQDLEGPHYLGSDGYAFCNKNENGLDKSSRLAGVIGQTKVVPPSISHRQVLENNFDDDAVVSGEDKPSKTVKMRTNGARDSDSENTGKFSSKQDAVKAKKLVINLGLRKANAVNLVSKASNRPVDPDMVSNGHAVSYSGVRGIKLSGKFGKVRSEDTVTLEKKHVPSKKENKSKTIMSNVDVPMIRGDGGIIGKHSGGSTGSDDGGNSDYEIPPTVHTMQKEARPLLKFKFRKPNPETQDSPAPAPFVTYERSNSIKRRRSKRKRLSHSLDKLSFNADEDASLSHQDSLVDEMLDASWILKKLGKGAEGKRVEIHKANNNSWHKGEIKGVLSSSTFSVTLDDGRVKMLELGKQGVRFVSQKQKRSKS